MYYFAWIKTVFWFATTTKANRLEHYSLNAHRLLHNPAVCRMPLASAIFTFKILFSIKYYFNYVFFYNILIYF